MTDEQPDLKNLLEENLEVAKDNNRLLKLIRRDAMIGLGVKVVLYLILLGVPLFFLSQYLGPLLEGFTATPGTSTGVFLAPSPEQIQQVRELYGL
ncbi:MAG TPA: hypothetical protein VFY28_00825 [Candidatus Paceibacterota bacterium]|nr:hypothetical protein [Candidatus Paceibacterota bacterium]